jgi:CheY-like chemotaxis protein
VSNRSVAAQSGPPGLILVVDDSESSRLVTSSWLRRRGHEVVEAETGAAGLEMVRTLPVDLVVLDVRLPDMSGFEVCEQIKADPATSAIPVVHVSANLIEPDDRAQGLSRGADAYLVEPVDPGVLVATVTAALRYYRARRTAEDLARRLNSLTATSLRIMAAHTVADLADAAASGAAALVGGPATALITFPDGAPCRARADASGEPATVDGDPDGELAALTSSAQAGARLMSGQDTTVVVARTKPHRPPVAVAVPSALTTAAEHHDLLMQLGQAVAVGVDALHAYLSERSVALTLQRSMLPGKLPRHPLLPMTARYVPATADIDIGGDFYEVTEVDGSFFVAIGDVTGHSIGAATVMGEVRHALRAYALEGLDPAAIIDRLDTLLQRFHRDSLTTMTLMRVDPAAGTMSIANAGHIPPLLIEPDGTADYLWIKGHILGVTYPRPPATTVPLTPGTTVLLMTDGLVERRDRDIADDLEHLRASVSPTESLDALSDRLLREYGQDKDDDIALLAFTVLGDESAG